jgi:hypothetical protein
MLPKCGKLDGMREAGTGAGFKKVEEFSDGSEKGCPSMSEAASACRRYVKIFLKRNSQMKGDLENLCVGCGVKAANSLGPTVSDTLVYLHSLVVGGKLTYQVFITLRELEGKFKEEFSPNGLEFEMPHPAGKFSKKPTLRMWAKDVVGAQKQGRRDAFWSQHAKKVIQEKDDFMTEPYNVCARLYKNVVSVLTQQMYSGEKATSGPATQIEIIENGTAGKNEGEYIYQVVSSDVKRGGKRVSPNTIDMVVEITIDADGKLESIDEPTNGGKCYMVGDEITVRKGVVGGAESDIKFTVKTVEAIGNGSSRFLAAMKEAM